MRFIILSTMLIGTIIIGSQSFAQEHHHGHGGGEETQSMVSIMQGMDKNVHKLTSAILSEDYAVIASSAHDIANHPGIAEQDLHHLFELLGSLKEGFIECDTAVHNLAKDVSKAGSEENMDLVLEKFSAMITKTVECHREYKPKSGNKK